MGFGLYQFEYIRKVMINKTSIKQSTLLTRDAKQWALENLTYLNKPMKFFGSSTKVEKGAAKFDTYIMYLQPSDKVARETLCIGAEKAGCKKACLISSGQLGMSVGQNAATKRTILFLLSPDYFYSQVNQEIARAETRATKTGIPALFRLNGTSDIDFSNIIKANPDSQFYDYTKVLSRVRGNNLENYDLTFSGSMATKQSISALKKAVNQGYRIAVAFNSKGLERDQLELPVNLQSFDETDLRHLDDNVVGFLSRKGSSLSERVQDDIEHSFFITSANINKFNNIIAKSA